MLSYFYLFLSSLALGMASIAVARAIGAKYNLFKPDRKIPYTGGVALALSFAAPYLLFNTIHKAILPPQMAWIIVFSLMLLTIEFVDDVRDFSLKTRLIVQIIFAAAFLTYAKKIQIYGLAPWFNYLLSFLWIVGVTNAFNLLDIADGLCAGVSLAVVLSFLVVALIKPDFILLGICAALLGALIPFFVLNLPPAKLFMGNCGSHFLGFLFAAMSMYADYAAEKNPYALLFPLFVLAFPIIDTFFLIGVRLKKGVVPLKKSDDHIFLGLIGAGWDRGEALASIYFLSLLWGLAGVLLILGSNKLFTAGAISAFFFTLKLLLKKRLFF